MAFYFERICFLVKLLLHLNWFLSKNFWNLLMIAFSLVYCSLPSDPSPSYYFPHVHEIHTLSFKYEIFTILTAEFLLVVIMYLFCIRSPTQVQRYQSFLYLFSFSHALLLTMRLFDLIHSLALIYEKIYLCTN